VAEWSALADQRSRSTSPVFTEVTAAVLGRDPAFRDQLRIGLDDWLTTIDSVLSRDSIGHHGVSVGDANGDGIEDLYAAQPAGLPNRLFLGRPDGTFEDATAAAGLGVLDDTAQSLFADVENDGDQDLVMVGGSGPLLFLNDGRGRFTHSPDAFVFEQGLRGSPTGLAMADFDRDGFLDLYVCTYLYFMGASVDKAGPPTPYHDAQNGPPDLLFKNDGRGRFFDVTAEVGLDKGNDRFGLAAAWGDYDADGWPDLLVANDFGRKNLYRNLGKAANGRVRFEDVAAAAGAEDHGAGMSAAFFDYDNDGRLDVYTGNMWTAPGLRASAQPRFKADAPPELREVYRRHARGNTLLRNRGDGRFEDVTLHAGVEMGRWAWASDALDFDGDGFEDLYVANGMITRPGDNVDLEGFFWRQLIPRSPLTLVAGTPYEDVWRVINRFLAENRSWASRQRNVLLRNDGRGRFDEVAGTAGLDLDQDGRSFAVFDPDGDGDPDLALMAARSTPQLRVFRNDFAGRKAALAVRLTGTRSNRDAVGTRVTVETDRLRGTKVVQAGSGFISQHSKTLLFGLGDSTRVERLVVEWPSGERQSFTGIGLGQRIELQEGGPPEAAPLRSAPPAAAPFPLPAAPRPPRASWLYEPFPAPDFTLPDANGAMRSLAALRGRPAVVLLFTTEAPEARQAFDSLAGARAELEREGLGTLAIALGGRLPTAPPMPAVLATPEVGGSFAVLGQHLFVGRQELVLPTTLLLNPAGEIVRVYRGPAQTRTLLADAQQIDASPAERLARAVPFPGTFYAAAGERNYVTYGRELVEQGFETPALAAFERAVQGRPGAFTLYSLGTLLSRSGQAAKARAAFERALEVQPDLAEASNDLGALLAQGGDLAGAITRFRAALAATPDYPDALNNLGYALLLTGRKDEAAALYEKALALQPDFPEALNNLGLLFARDGDLTRAEPFFRQALARRPSYGEAGNNLALVLVNRGDAAGAVALLQEMLERSPESEAPYLTLAKIHLSAGRTREGLQALERLLQRNPSHATALELARQFKAR
jgi:Tfp pilus assembly protein PilF